MTKKQAKEIARIWIGSIIRKEAALVSFQLEYSDYSDIITEAIQELGDKIQQDSDYCSDLNILTKRILNAPGSDTGK